MIPSLDPAFDAWAAALAKLKPLEHHRLLNDWRCLLADQNLFKSHGNPLFICRQRLLASARAMGFPGATK